MRVLLVAPFNSKKFLTRRFDFFGWRLANGFIRNGHFVSIFSDRDSKKTALGIKSIGRRIASARLVEIARHVRPDLLCLHTYDLISNEAIWNIRKILPECRVAIVECDALFDKKCAADFDEKLPFAEFAFATTGGATLAKYASKCPVAFIPNLVDRSADLVRSFAETEKSSDVFCACGFDGPAGRWQMIDELCRQFPSLQYALHGRDKRNQLSAGGLVDAMRRSRIGLNVNQFEGDLYASDRMAIYIGNGLLLATYRKSGLSRYFDESEMIFFDSPKDLGEQITRAISDDKVWRIMAERGYRKALEIMDGTKVTDFIARMTMGLQPPEGWAFTKEIYCSEARKMRPSISALTSR